MRAAQAYDETNKEPLGLDESGQIKLSHDADDIKKMVASGVIKPNFSPAPKLAVSAAPFNAAQAEQTLSAATPRTGAPAQQRAPGLDLIREEEGGQQAAGAGKKMVTVVAPPRRASAAGPGESERTLSGAGGRRLDPSQPTPRQLDGGAPSQLSPLTTGRTNEREEPSTPAPLQRSGKPGPVTAPAAFSQFDGDVDSEFAGKMEEFVKESIEQACAELSLKIRHTKQELEGDLKKAVGSVRAQCTSQVNETQAAMSSIQAEQDGMLEKVKRSQAEILLINRNIASNLKKLRQDQVDVGQKANVNQQLIVHMLD